MKLRPARLLPAAVVLLIIASAAVAAIEFATASGNDLPGRFDPYLHRPTGATADPINLIFRGGDAEDVAAAVQNVLGWPGVRGSEMTFEDQGSNRPTASQFGLNLGGGSRLHLRIEAVDKSTGQAYVLAGVHRDDSVPCGHIGMAFNRARDDVAQAFSRLGYSVTMLRLQNTLPGHQCDGRMTAGDGSAAMIDLASHRPPAAPPIFPAGRLLPALYLELR